MSSSPLQAVVAICDDALGAMVPGEGRTLVEAVRARLLQPLRVTVAGGVSSGKSTLVNALLGQRIAAVDVGECTRVVTTFRYDHHQRAEARLVDGSTVRVPLVDGQLPPSLPVPAEQVDEIVVHLSNQHLTRLDVVDTPGINTVTEVNEELTAAFLGIDTGSRPATASAGAVSRADALVFLMPYLREADARVLQGFRDLFQGTGLSALNAVGVLSKIDRLSRDRSPLDVAAPIATRVAGDLRGLVGDVVPVIGLLAETARSGRFGEEEARALAEVAEVDDEFDREDLLLSPEDFLRSDLIALAPPMRRRLLDFLDIHGLQVALDAIDRGGRGASAILQALDRASGLERLEAIVLGRFGDHAELLKANAAICDLLRLSYLRADSANGRVLRSLRDPLERIELDPSMHRLRVLEVLQAVSTGSLRLPDALMTDLERLVLGDDVDAQLASSRHNREELALAASARWATFGQDPRRSPAEASLARVVKQAYELLLTELALDGADR